MPPAGKAPRLEMLTSMFADQWQAAIERPTHTDVTFLVDGQHRFEAHQVILCAASQLFQHIFDANARPTNQFAGLDTTFTVSDLESGRVPGIAALRSEQTVDSTGSSQSRTVMELNADIKPKTFVAFLQFLYTGIVKNLESLSTEELCDLRLIARTFHCKYLESVVENIEKKEDFLNPSIGTFLNDETGRIFKETYFNRPRFADVVFNVEGQKVYGHKAVVSARSDVMAAMFEAHFMEGLTDMPEVIIHGTTADIFLAVLEYIYTDHAPIEDGDAVGIMVLADQYCLPRLVRLCELYITLAVDRAVSRNIQKAEIDVIGLLLTSQACNAKQLEEWCLHFISSNYLAFIERAEFSQLAGDNLKYIETNRWPPVSYLTAVEQYEKEMKAAGKSCSVM